MPDRRITEALAGAYYPVQDLWNNQPALSSETDNKDKLSIKGTATSATSYKALFESRYVDVQTTFAKTASTSLDISPKTPQRPHIEPPEHHTPINNKQVVAELNDLFDEIKNIDSDKNILRLIFARIQLQRDLRGMSMVQTHERVSLEQTFQKAKRKDEVELQLKYEESMRALLTSDTFSTVFTVLNFFGLAAAVAAAVMSGGAAIGTVITIVQALVSGGAGVNEALKLHYKGESKTHKNAMDRSEHERTVSGRIVASNLENNTNDEKSLVPLAEQQRKMLDEDYKNTQMDPAAAGG